MKFTTVVNGATLNVETLGEGGPWISLSPGGRGGLDGVRALGETLAAQGFRILLHDRRNCGGSDVVISGEKSEQEIWAADLAALVRELRITQIIVGGGSSGCRLALLFAIREPDLTVGLLLWHVTGGQVAATQLGEGYYGQYVRLARDGGMQAVCDSDFFAERIAANPGNAERLLTLTPATFIEVMSRWQAFFTKGADLPVIGATEAELKSITVPACIVPGADAIHPREVAENLTNLLPDAELHYPFERDERALLATQSADVIVARHQERLGQIFSDFLNRRAGDLG